MPQNAPPSQNYANYDSLQGVFNTVLRKTLMATDDMLPAQIIAYDRATNRAQVQPLIIAVTTLGERLVRAQIASLPVLQLSAGGVMLSFNLNPGDMGWIKSNDRDISLFKQSCESSVPNTKRLHSFEDAIFIPDAMNDYFIAPQDLNNAILQTKDGIVCIALWPTQLKITAPNSCVTDTKSYTPNANAVLDVQSTTRAFKVPRMTRGQRDAIPDPTGGFMVYVTDFPPGFSSYTDGSGWS